MKMWAFTLVELAVAVAVVFVLAVLFVANFSDAREKARRTTCTSHLKVLGSAFRSWGEDHLNLYPMQYFTNRDGTAKYTGSADVFRYFQPLSNELGNTPAILWCPSDTTRRPADSFAQLTTKNLSYFAGLDADETFPAMWLDGDRNLLTNGAPVNPGLITIHSNDTVGWSTAKHKGGGNVGLADGSVQNVGQSMTGFTNRIVVP
jgi:prepilin-type processing-associated H-X9-DG protein